MHCPYQALPLLSKFNPFFKLYLPMPPWSLPYSPPPSSTLSTPVMLTQLTSYYLALFQYSSVSTYLCLLLCSQSYYKLFKDRHLSLLQNALQGVEHIAGVHKLINSTSLCGGLRDCTWMTRDQRRLAEKASIWNDKVRIQNNLNKLKKWSKKKSYNMDFTEYKEEKQALQNHVQE